ncbi:MAG: hypothetical protein V4654_07490 [Bdellovibrionota bacterium]
MKLITAFLLLYGFLSHAADINIKNKKIFYKDKELHPGCIRAISSQLNGDATSMIVNIEFEKPNGQFIGRGCMTANQYYQKPFMRNDYLTYVDDEKNIKDILKDPILRFDGFGYKLAKKIDDKIFAIDIREFTTGSADFLTTVVVELVENPFFSITPEGKAVSTTVVGLKKVGEVLKGTVNWQEKLNEALKNRKTLEKKTKNKLDLI